MDALDLLAEDRELITYRKSLNNITGGVMPTLLLQQILFHAKNKGWQPFYKFRAPCEHELYKSGDSWIEELGFSPREFDSALEKIGTKIIKGVNKIDVLHTVNPKSLIIYWTDANRVTWYQVNRELLGNCVKCNYLENGVCAITWELLEVQLPITETPTETPTERAAEPNRTPGARQPAHQVIPAYKVFVEVTKKHCLRGTQIEVINKAVGSTPEALDRWRKVVAAWDLAGYVLTNVAGMLDWFRDGIPQYKNGNSKPPEMPKKQKFRWIPNDPNQQPVDITPTEAL